MFTGPCNNDEQTPAPRRKDYRSPTPTDDLNSDFFKASADNVTDSDNHFEPAPSSQNSRGKKKSFTPLPKIKNTKKSPRARPNGSGSTIPESSSNSNSKKSPAIVHTTNVMSNNSESSCRSNSNLITKNDLNAKKSHLPTVCTNRMESPKPINTALPDNQQRVVQEKTSQEKSLTSEEPCHTTDERNDDSAKINETISKDEIDEIISIHEETEPEVVLSINEVPSSPRDDVSARSSQNRKIDEAPNDQENVQNKSSISEAGVIAPDELNEAILSCVDYDVKNKSISVIEDLNVVKQDDSDHNSKQSLSDDDQSHKLDSSKIYAIRTDSDGSENLDEVIPPTAEQVGRISNIEAVGGGAVQCQLNSNINKVDIKFCDGIKKTDISDPTVIKLKKFGKGSTADIVRTISVGKVGNKIETEYEQQQKLDNVDETENPQSLAMDFESNSFSYKDLPIVSAEKSFDTDSHIPPRNVSGDIKSNNEACNSNISVISAGEMNDDLRTPKVALQSSLLEDAESSTKKPKRSKRISAYHKGPTISQDSIRSLPDQFANDQNHFICNNNDIVNKSVSQSDKKSNSIEKVIDIYPSSATTIVFRGDVPIEMNDFDALKTNDSKVKIDENPPCSQTTIVFCEDDLHEINDNDIAKTNDLKIKSIVEQKIGSRPSRKSKVEFFEKSDVPDKHNVPNTNNYDEQNTIEKITPFISETVEKNDQNLTSVASTSIMSISTKNSLSQDNSIHPFQIGSKKLVDLNHVKVNPINSQSVVLNAPKLSDSESEGTVIESSQLPMVVKDLPAEGGQIKFVNSQSKFTTAKDMLDAASSKTVVGNKYSAIDEDVLPRISYSNPYHNSGNVQYFELGNKSLENLDTGTSEIRKLYKEVSLQYTDMYNVFNHNLTNNNGLSNCELVRKGFEALDHTEFVSPKKLTSVPQANGIIHENIAEEIHQDLVHPTLTNLYTENLTSLYNSPARENVCNTTTTTDSTKSRGKNSTGRRNKKKILNELPPHYYHDPKEKKMPTSDVSSKGSGCRKKLFNTRQTVLLELTPPLSTVNEMSLNKTEITLGDIVPVESSHNMEESSKCSEHKGMLKASPKKKRGRPPKTENSKINIGQAGPSRKFKKPSGATVKGPKFFKSTLDSSSTTAEKEVKNSDYNLFDTNLEERKSPPMSRRGIYSDVSSCNSKRSWLKSQKSMRVVKKYSKKYSNRTGQNNSASKNKSKPPCYKKPLKVSNQAENVSKATNLRNNSSAKSLSEKKSRFGDRNLRALKRSVCYEEISTDNESQKISNSGKDSTHDSKNEQLWSSKISRETDDSVLRDCSQPTNFSSLMIDDLQTSEPEKSLEKSSGKKRKLRFPDNNSPIWPMKRSRRCIEESNLKTLLKDILPVEQEGNKLRRSLSIVSDWMKRNQDFTVPNNTPVCKPRNESSPLDPMDFSVISAGEMNDNLNTSKVPLQSTLLDDAGSSSKNPKRSQRISAFSFPEFPSSVISPEKTRHSTEYKSCKGDASDYRESNEIFYSTRISQSNDDQDEQNIDFSRAFDDAVKKTQDSTKLNTWPVSNYLYYYFVRYLLKAYY